MIKDINEALNLKLKDEVFVIETDTVYGLGCLYNSLVGSNRIMEIKNRSKAKVFSILVSNLDQVKSLSIDSDKYNEYFKKYWPGAVTFILKKSDLVKDFVCPFDTVGLRMPDDKLTLEFLEKHGPMIMTSLNYSGEDPVLTFSDALKYEDKVDFIIKGKDLNSIPSTVYDLINKKTIREGNIKIEL
ncbi:MAG: threonylcarbamoyl-AMP synthase [Gammaproteobacteria bacterium]|nr:threonylcarbamoyl-AMP synthase [Gammaproteobacteria bacterium]